MNVYIEALVNSWSEGTCVPSSRNAWKNHDSSYGQCAVTALLINDLFGGKIMRCMTSTGSHYYNNIDGENVDLTIDQFVGERPDYQNGEERTRDYLLSNENTKQRYLVLLKNFYNNLNKFVFEKIDNDERIDKDYFHKLVDFSTFEVDDFSENENYETVQFDLAAQNTGNIFVYNHFKADNRYVLEGTPFLYTFKEKFYNIPALILENIFDVAIENKAYIRELKKLKNMF